MVKRKKVKFFLIFYVILWTFLTPRIFADQTDPYSRRLSEKEAEKLILEAAKKLGLTSKPKGDEESEVGFCLDHWEWEDFCSMGYYHRDTWEVRISDRVIDRTDIGRTIMLEYAKDTQGQVEATKLLFSRYLEQPEVRVTDTEFRGYPAFYCIDKVKDPTYEYSFKAAVLIGNYLLWIDECDSRDSWNNLGIFVDTFNKYFPESDKTPDFQKAEKDLPDKSDETPDFLKVEKVLPDKNEINVPFEGFLGEVHFSGKLDKEKIKDFGISFFLSYKDDQGMSVKVEGIKGGYRQSGNMLIFRFESTTNLMDGVKYQANIRWGDKKNGTQTFNWTFSTAPDLEIKVRTVQVLEGQPLVMNKDTVVRVWAKWKNPNPPVHPDWQVSEAHLGINLELEDSSGFQKNGRKVIGAWDSRYPKKYFPEVQGPKKNTGEIIVPQRQYDKELVNSGLDSIDFFTYTPDRTGEGRITAVVAPVPESPFRLIRYYGTEDIEIRKQIRPLRFKYVAVAVGKWRDKTPQDLSQLVNGHHRYLKALFPVEDIFLVETDPSKLEVFETTRKADLNGSIALLQLGEYLKEYNEATVGEKIDRVIGIVPKDYFFSGRGVSLPERRFFLIDVKVPLIGKWGRLATKYAVLVENETAPYITAHEIGHTYGMAYEPFKNEHSNGLYIKREIIGYDVPDWRSKHRAVGIIGYKWYYEDFMESHPQTNVWISPKSYKYLLELFTEK